MSPSNIDFNAIPAEPEAVESAVEQKEKLCRGTHKLLHELRPLGGTLMVQRPLTEPLQQALSLQLHTMGGELASALLDLNVSGFGEAVTTA